MPNFQNKNDHQSGGPAQRAIWNDEMEKVLIDGFLAEVRLGKRAENGFKKESYVRIVNLVNDAPLVTIDMQQVKNKLAMVSPSTVFQNE